GVFSGLLFVHALLRRPKGVARRIGLAAAGAIPFVVWELAYFGTLIPNPIRAKSVVYELPPGQVLTVLAEALSPIAPLAPRPSALILGVAAVLLLGLVAAGHEQARKTLPQETRELVWLLAAGGLIIGLGYLIAGGLVFPWYLPLVAIPFSFALWALLARSRAGQVAIVVVLILPHAIGLGRSLTAAVADPALYRYFAQNARVGKYLEVGRRLDARYPDTTLLSSEVGALGWAFQGRVLDGAGLISPEAIRHHPMRVPEERSLGFIGAIPVGYVAERRPGLI
ncbi:MAG: hypothetical protein GWO02_15205, partial [Gammaproteobacteria bacterium]|nr:hypothetical protein [Gammaproteobacteria bacterium]